MVEEPTKGHRLLGLYGWCKNESGVKEGSMLVFKCLELHKRYSLKLGKDKKGSETESVLGHSPPQLK
jgi:hypothetical protein